MSEEQILISNVRLNGKELSKEDSLEEKIEHQR